MRQIHSIKKVKSVLDEMVYSKFPKRPKVFEK